MTIDVPGTDKLLAAAGRIAENLCDTTVWSQDRRSCGWQGPVLVFGNDRKSYIEVSDVGTTLYSGTAGIALFLGEIAALTENARFAETALAAIRHAYLRPAPHPSLYSGATGTALVLLRLSECLKESGLQESCREMLQPVLQAIRHPDKAVEKCDVISGLAGMIQGLLSIHRRLPDAALLDGARRLGWALCERADWEEEYCCWQPDGPEDLMDKPLAGISHGSSGIGAALLTLHEQSGEKDFLVTGRGAFAYDDAIFDHEMQTWPDKRKTPTHSATETWCYGAPGILMARLLAAANDAGCREHHRQIARLAAEATVRSLHKGWMHPGADSCICHGSIGACEALVTAGEYGLGTDFRAEGVKAATELVRRHDAAGDWPLRVGASPELMMGLAGVGHGLLRVAHPERVEPVLMIR